MHGSPGEKKQVLCYACPQHMKTGYWYQPRLPPHGKKYDPDDISRAFGSSCPWTLVTEDNILLLFFPFKPIEVFSVSCN